MLENEVCSYHVCHVARLTLLNFLAATRVHAIASNAVGIEPLDVYCMVACSSAGTASATDSVAIMSTDLRLDASIWNVFLR